jgi:hypothetical protein
MVAVEDLPVGPADAEIERLDQQLAGLRVWLGSLGQLRAVGPAWDDCHRAHVPYP